MAILPRMSCRAQRVRSSATSNNPLPTRTPTQTPRVLHSSPLPWFTTDQKCGKPIPANNGKYSSLIRICQRTGPKEDEQRKDIVDG